MARKVIVILFTLYVCYAQADDNAAMRDGYVESLQFRAVQSRLYDDPMWQRLLLYKKTLFGIRSEVDDTSFFLAKQGKTRPLAELNADLHAFFDPDSAARCRFPARFQWLSRQLQFDPARVAAVRCLRLDRLRRKLSPQQLVLVFPSAHPDSLASVFGHSLLRFDHPDNRSAMLKTSVNFAAQLPKHVSGLRYVAAGIGGGFKGAYTLSPYFVKLRQYAEIENRDIWEYTLDLSADEVDFIFLHVVELLGKRFDYYFFKENCAYHVLSLLEVIRPQQRLTDRFHMWTLPVDVVKTLRRQHLIKSVRFVPSLLSKIQLSRNRLSRQARAAAKRLQMEKQQSAQSMTTLPLPQQASLLDWMVDVEHYRRLDQQGEVDEWEKSLLKQRSLVPLSSVPPPVRVPRWRPEQGHGSMAWSVGTGHTQDKSYTDFRWRAGYHGFLDNSEGHNRNASVRVMDTQLRLYNNGDMRLAQLDIFHIQVLHGENKLLRRPTWQSGAHWKTVSHAGKEHGLLTLAAGVGHAKNAAGGLLNAYGMVNGTIEFGDALPSRYAVRPQLEAGLLWHPHAYLRGRVACSRSWGMAGDQHNHNTCALEQAMHINRHLSLRLYYQHSNGYFRSEQSGLRIHYYF